MNKFTQSDDYRRDELAELEALYYDMTTKSYIND